jgi:hypothetical protein
MEEIKATSTSGPLQPKNKNAFKNFMWKFFTILILLFALAIYWFCYNVYSDGERTGLLTKLSRKGNIFKTYEGEMLIGNFQQAPNVMVPEKYAFSVKDEKLADTLMKLQGKVVSLKYNQYRRSLPWRGESEYVVTGLERVED